MHTGTADGIVSKSSIFVASVSNQIIHKIILEL